MAKILIRIFFVLLFIVTACSKDKPIKKEDQPIPLDPFATFFNGEVKPDKVKPGFNGSYYRKLVSSKDRWLGISGTVILPEITFDTWRRNVYKPGQFLDNPSIYMGGNMNGQETDIGLTWEIIKEEDGSISAERKAFRPFFRRTAYAETGQTSKWIDGPADKKYYWYPGEEITMSIQVVNDKKILFIIEGAGKRYETEFESDGYIKSALGEFKRVNAIDQVGNEGRPVQPTKTRVENAVWKETHLFRMFEDKVVKVPIHEGRFTDMRCPERSYFKVTATEDQHKIGAEVININGEGF